MKEKLTNCYEIKDMDPEVLAEVLRFLYTGQALNLENMAPDLLAAADMFLLDRLKELCEDRLKMMCEEVMYNNLTVDNVWEAIILADRHSAHQLKARSSEFMFSHFLEVWHTPGGIYMMDHNPRLWEEHCAWTKQQPALGTAD